MIYHSTDDTLSFSAGRPGRSAHRDGGDRETAAPGAQAAGHQEESAGVSLQTFQRIGRISLHNQVKLAQ